MPQNLLDNALLVDSFCALMQSESPEQPANIINFIKRFVDFELSAVFLYSKSHRPQLLFDSLGTQRDMESDLKIYMAGAYLLDPLYYAAVEQEEKWGVNILDDVAPDNFYDTEIYKTYYRETDIIDMVDITYRCDADRVIDLSFSRCKPSRRFSQKDLKALKILEPLLEVLLTKLSNQLTVDESPPLHKALHSAMENFGSSLLTVREREVVRLILGGHSLKSAAERLSLSESTLKQHRWHIYNKLDISSQSELFSLFIDALSNYKDNAEDPLASYHKAPTA
ncbi:helix-turn-helix transcriptional regulator [Dasania sp. GY-MA-18]|uniref:LuxR C-terminal-related transcriptional regulator n=1 Tax=Dasania phycosphaerae TaxID=2950436 RepID=A0A9J6RSH5_9GAMM|nr:MULTISPECIES: LuxR C-terminal-related transcriptional regulator [Dasania]MCR8924460.1 helix-turn-helix transcriptional regulator [Dasania sp. GY-MA-18]MCZ0867135.1 LuxR C-terminal-related transcriptional regulator [Dasania phycosphaerae]MCZ0870587.1 LuxR C-terminal-related transcriptional regulator [Dasania phycosphaerae]